MLSRPRNPTPLNPKCINKYPPMMVPNAMPRLMAIEYSDMTVPLITGICSRVRLSDAVYLIDEKKQLAKTSMAATIEMAIFM